MSDRDPPDPHADWPYAASYVLETADPDLIESHAVAILARALNIGQVVAFLGAGTSMSYGRIGWNALVEHLKDRVEAKYDAYKRQIGKDWEQPKYKHLERLHRSIHELGIGRSDIKAERFPMIFQLCEQLSDRLAAAWRETDKAHEPFDFRKEALNAIRSDVGHTMRLLEAARPELADHQTRLEDVRAELQRLGASDVFFREALQAVVFVFAASDSSFGGGKIEGRPGASVRNGLHPTRRYLVAAGLSLMEEAAVDAFLDSQLTVLKATQPDDRGPREGILDLYRDPLRLLHERLGIQRYLTTNYDEEINRYLRSRVDDYGEADTEEARSRQLREIVFDHGQTGELVRFLSGTPGGRTGVAQLHGSVTTGRIVVTEVDYQKLYLKPGPDRDIVDQAVQYAFGANPLLFVGSNMGEDDLLRPLRHFMSTPAAFGERVAVALLPGTESKAAQTEEKIALLGRHGVYAVHFGAATVMSNGGAKATPVLVGDWLSQAASIRTRLLVACRSILTLSTPPQGEMGKPENNSDSIDEFRRQLAGLKPMRQSDRNSIADEIAPVAQPVAIEGVQCDPSRQFEIDVEVDILNAAAIALRDIARAIPRGNVNATTFLIGKQRIARCLKIAIEGAWDAVLATFTCARLLKARLDWDEWRREWGRLPVPRSTETIYSTISAIGTSDDRPKLFAGGKALYSDRHVAAISVDPAKDPGQGRFFISAASQSFYELSAALQADTVFRSKTGRRILMLVGERGAGRGHLFGTLTDQRESGSNEPKVDRLKQLLADIQPAGWRYAGIGLYNLSYSHEIASVLDRIAHLLYTNASDALIDDGADHKARLLAERWHSLRADRLQRLKLVLDEWREVRERSQRRVFVAINAATVLFDQTGRPKNGYLRRIVNLLSDDCYAKVPIDLIFVFRPEHVPLTFRKGGGSTPLLDLRRSGGDQKSEAAAAIRLADLNIGPIDSDRSDVVAIHVLRPTRACIFAFAFYPRLAVLIARQVMLESPGHRQDSLFQRMGLKASPGYPGVFDESNSAGERDAINRALRDFTPWQGRIQARTIVPVLTVFVACWLETRSHADVQPSVDVQPPLAAVIQSFTNAAVKLQLILGNSEEDVKSEPHRDTLRRTMFFLSALALQGLQASGTPAPEFVSLSQLEEFSTGARNCVEAFYETVLAYDEHMRSLHDAIGRGRMALTLLCAGAFEHTTDLTFHKVDATDPEGVKLRRLVEEATGRIDRWLRRTTEGLRLILEERRASHVIDAVMKVFDRHHRDGHRLPFSIKIGTDETAGWKVDRSNPAQWRLCRVILWHLAVIGHPVDISVLMECAEIRAAARQTIRSIEDKTEQLLRASVQAALALCVSRCVVFCIRPASTPLDRNAGGVAPQRYTVHRLLQRHVLAEMGSAPLETTEWDQFTISLYASQPDGVPQVTAQAHDRIFRVVKSLTGYPDETGQAEIVAAMGAGPPSPEERYKLRLRSRLLRAGYGIVRTIYSAGVVHHLRDGGGDLGMEKRPLEQYRRLVRWMLRAALAIEDRAIELGYRPRAPGILTRAARSPYDLKVGEGSSVAEPDSTAVTSDGDLLAGAEVGPTGEAASGNGAASESTREPEAAQTPNDANATPASTEVPADPGIDQGLPETLEDVMPFYAEEIVWLYNECAVLSLMQGIMPDADALFAMARRATESTLEPDPRGPLHVRILINNAMVAIERGRGERLRSALEAVSRLTEEHAVPPLIARGYLGLLDHLAGNLESATRHYKAAQSALARRRRSRAAGLICRHLGDLQRRAHMSRDSEYMTWLNQASHYAEAGNHLDLRHMVILSEVRGQLAQKQDLDKVHRRLDAVERYALQLGHQRLLCEVEELRARSLLLRGETRLALASAMRSLEIANRCDLAIRKATALAIIGEIYLERGLLAQARPLIDLGIRIGEQCSSSAALKRLQELRRRIASAA